MTAGDSMGLPWATLDPAANAKALMDIQLRGLQAAGQVVERLVRATDGDGPRAGPSGESAGGPGGGASGRARPEGGSVGGPAGGPAGGPEGRPGQWSTGLDGMVDLWATMTKSWMRAMSRMSPQANTTDGTGTSGREAPGADRVEVAIDRPGSGAPLVIRPGSEAELWLHNGTGADVHDIRFACSSLVSPSGKTLRATTITFDPPQVDVLPKRSSRGVLVRAAAGKGPRAAEPYRGVIVATGAGDLWVPIEVAAPHQR